jgi:hypothetical protein
MIDRIGEITHELPVAITTHVVIRKRPSASDPSSAVMLSNSSYEGIR